MVSIIAGEEIPQGVPVFHSGYGGTDHVSVPVSGHRDSVVADRGVVTTAHELARGKRAAVAVRLTPIATAVESAMLAQRLSRKTLEHVFEPFLTVKQDSLGLASRMSQSIATAHGGEIWPERKRRIVSLRAAFSEER